MLIPRRIVPADWPWIQDWFTDERLNAELGPLDVEWLEHVLADPGGVELVVTDPAAPQVPLALVGVVWATAEHPHTITDLAVSPALREAGSGVVPSPRCSAGTHIHLAATGSRTSRRTTPLLTRSSVRSGGTPVKSTMACVCIRPRGSAAWNSDPPRRVIPRMPAPESASVAQLLESVDLTVTHTRRVSLAPRERWSAPVGATSLLYLDAGELRGVPVAACATGPRRCEITTSEVADPAQAGLSAGSALLALGRTPHTFTAAEPTTLIVVTLELTETAQRLHALLPDPLTMVGFSAHDPAVAALASNMGHPEPDSADDANLGTPLRRG